jgi:hypothetical protein
MWMWKEIGDARAKAGGSGHRNATTAKAKAQAEKEDLSKQIAKQIAVVSSLPQDHAKRPQAEAALKDLQQKVAAAHRPARNSGDGAGIDEAGGAGETGGAGGGGAGRASSAAANNALATFVPLFSGLTAALTETAEARAERHAHEERMEKIKQEAELEKLRLLTSLFGSARGQ